MPYQVNYEFSTGIYIYIEQQTTSAAHLSDLFPTHLMVLQDNYALKLEGGGDNMASIRSI